MMRILYDLILNEVIEVIKTVIVLKIYIYLYGLLA